MGKRGPAPKPTNVRLLHGDDKKNPQRVNRDEPQPGAAEVGPPAWLSDEALEVWQQYAPDLTRTKVLTAWDVEAFAVWCDAVVRRRRAVAELAAWGEIYEVPVCANGEVVGHKLVRNPWNLVLVEADGQLQRYAARFGLTPSDRSQLKVGEARRDPTEDLLSG